jgi:hypothetical protein
MAQIIPILLLNITDLFDFTRSDNVSLSVLLLNEIHYYFEIVVPVDTVWFPKFHFEFFFLFYHYFSMKYR